MSISERFTSDKSYQTKKINKITKLATYFY